MNETSICKHKYSFTYDNDVFCVDYQIVERSEEFISRSIQFLHFIRVGWTTLTKHCAPSIHKHTKMVKVTPERWLHYIALQI